MSRTSFHSIYIDDKGLSRKAFFSTKKWTDPFARKLSRTMMFENNLSGTTICLVGKKKKSYDLQNRCPGKMQKYNSKQLLAK